MINFYIASKVIHANKWKVLREQGWPVNASWIDCGEYGAISDWGEHWVKCIREAAGSTFCLAYCEEDEVLKGALCEIGAALAAGKRVLFVGNYEYVKAKRYSIMEHPLVTKFAKLEDALKVIADYETDRKRKKNPANWTEEEIVENEKIWEEENSDKTKKKTMHIDMDKLGKTIADMLTRKN